MWSDRELASESRIELESVRHTNYTIVDSIEKHFSRVKSLTILVAYVDLDLLLAVFPIIMLEGVVGTFTVLLPLLIIIIIIIYHYAYRAGLVMKWQLTYKIDIKSALL